ncbi:class I SAM-dependent methyltransferase [Nocardiopsis composta]|uniref:Phospholipid N-methyltransferase n=1 Tax=Nocardiopsis composta TaxID=157465 RepID=A0A7W8QHC3_9ACTN|nr:methyltransferase domain-containing protein [Nocardiopsis composta]MBB5430468.1 phospholipid N-methyltransferase [Nocardiopsis composta]
MLSDTLTVIREFCRAPVHTGALSPSSRGLAEAITVTVPATGDPVVVELGPGTGPFSGAIQRRLGGRGRHLAVEINPRFAEVVSARFPEVEVVRGDAAELVALLKERGVDGADAVVSGLPWAVFSPGAQRSILTAIAASLAPGAAFTTFTYEHARPMPAAIRFRRLLGTVFEEVVTGRTVWSNFPPAVVYHARRSRTPRG